MAPLLRAYVRQTQRGHRQRGRQRPRLATPAAAARPPPPAAAAPHRPLSLRARRRRLARALASRSAAAPRRRTPPAAPLATPTPPAIATAGAGRVDAPPRDLSPTALTARRAGLPSPRVRRGERVRERGLPAPGGGVRRQLCAVGWRRRAWRSGYWRLAREGPGDAGGSDAVGGAPGSADVSGGGAAVGGMEGRGGARRPGWRWGPGGAGPEGPRRMDPRLINPGPHEDRSLPGSSFVLVCGWLIARPAAGGGAAGVLPAGQPAGGQDALGLAGHPRAARPGDRWDQGAGGGHLGRAAGRGAGHRRRDLDLGSGGGLRADRRLDPGRRQRHVHGVGLARWRAVHPSWGTSSR